MKSHLFVLASYLEYLNVMKENYLLCLSVRNQPWTHIPIFWIMQVSCHIIKLVLRNNALTTLRGIENLKSLEGLDVSYNIISNFSELEFLVGLLYLKSLWLEGNPLCCARWYRAQVFSFFAYPEEVSLFSFLSYTYSLNICLLFCGRMPSLRV